MEKKKTESRNEKLSLRKATIKELLPVRRAGEEGISTCKFCYSSSM